MLKENGWLMYPFVVEFNVFIWNNSHFHGELNQFIYETVAIQEYEKNILFSYFRKIGALLVRHLMIATLKIPSC